MKCTKQAFEVKYQEIHILSKDQRSKITPRADVSAFCASAYPLRDPPCRVLPPSIDRSTN